jgi:hypothetical protein
MSTLKMVCNYKGNFDRMSTENTEKTEKQEKPSKYLYEYLKKHVDMSDFLERDAGQNEQEAPRKWGLGNLPLARSADGWTHVQAEIASVVDHSRPAPLEDDRERWIALSTLPKRPVTLAAHRKSGILHATGLEHVPADCHERPSPSDATIVVACMGYANRSIIFWMAFSNSSSVS